MQLADANSEPAKDLMKMVDTNGDGEIDFQEFMQMMRTWEMTEMTRVDRCYECNRSQARHSIHRVANSHCVKYVLELQRRW